MITEMSRADRFFAAVRLEQDSPTDAHSRVAPISATGGERLLPVHARRPMA